MPLPEIPPEDQRQRKDETLAALRDSRGVASAADFQGLAGAEYVERIRGRWARRRRGQRLKQSHGQAR